MNRRQANKHILCALAAPFAVPVLSQSPGGLNEAGAKTPYLFKKSTWADKHFSSAAQSCVTASLGNIGIPPADVDIGFPLGWMKDPAEQFYVPIESIGLGSPFADELLGGFDPDGFLNQMSGLVNMTSQQSAEVAKALMAVNEAFGGPPVENYMGNTLTAATAVGLAASSVMFGAAGMIVYGAALRIGATAFEDDDNDGWLNIDDAYPNDSTRHVVAPDMDGDGLPDDTYPMGPIVFLRDTMRAMGVTTRLPEGSSAAASFTATDSSLMVDFSITIEGITSSVRTIYEG